MFVGVTGHDFLLHVVRWLMSLILTSVLTVATPAPVVNVFDTLPRPVLAGHRGGLALYPENTLTGFSAALSDYPGMVLEFDVRPLKDGTLVVAHDDTVDRVSTNTTGRVADMSGTQWSKVRIRDPRGGDAPASTFQEVIDEYGGTDVPLLVELKDPKLADKFVEMVWPIRDQTIVASFDRTIVSRLVRTGFKTMQLSTRPPDIVPGVYCLGINQKNITTQSVADANSAGVETWTYTPNTQTDVDRLIGLGVTGIITNDPRLVIPS